MIVDQDRIRAAAMRGVPPPPMGLFLQICSHSDDILVQACARCKCSAISIVQCIFGALFLGLGCNIFLVLRLWCYALSAISRRLATAVAHLFYINKGTCFSFLIFNFFHKLFCEYYCWILNHLKVLSIFHLNMVCRLSNNNMIFRNERNRCCCEMSWLKFLILLLAQLHSCTVMKCCF